MTNNKGQSKTSWDTLTKTKTVSKFLSNHKTGLTIFVSSLVLYFGSITFYNGNPQENSLDSEELKALVSKTKNSIDTVKKKTDPFIREILIQNEAKKLGIRSDEYRKLLDLQKSSSDLLPDVRRDNFLSPIIWFYQDLYPSQRLKLTKESLLWAFGSLSSLTIIFVGGRFLLEIPLRERQAKYQAWQVIHTAHGQRNSPARISALEDLMEQGESLSKLILEQGADIMFANLEGADLTGAHLEGVNLSGANLESAVLELSMLKGAHLVGTKLKGAYLNLAYLENADLLVADLKGSNLKNTHLEGANLKGSRLEGANLAGAFLESAKELTREQLKDSYLCDTKLPDDLKDLANRNADEDEKEWIKKWHKKLKLKPSRHLAFQDVLADIEKPIN